MATEESSYGMKNRIIALLMHGFTYTTNEALDFNNFAFAIFARLVTTKAEIKIIPCFFLFCLLQIYMRKLPFSMYGTIHHSYVKKYGMFCICTNTNTNMMNPKRRSFLLALLPFGGQLETIFLLLAVEEEILTAQPTVMSAKKYSATRKVKRYLPPFCRKFSKAHKITLSSVTYRLKLLKYLPRHTKKMNLSRSIQTENCHFN